MSKIYLPYASQFDLMNENLAKIANAIGSDIDLSTWAGVQKAVRAGVAPDLIPVGTQLVVSHSKYGEMMFDVVAHNYFKSAHNKNAHTMTLLSHNNIATLQFDNTEAFYYADAELPSGDYRFTIATTYGSWVAGTYYFGLSKAIPKGAQLCITGQSSTPLETLSVGVYANPAAEHPSETAPILLTGQAGTNLGTFGVELNHPHRVSYGSNNYKESAIRQFLNSSSPAGSVWAPQTKFDRRPSWMGSLDGFAHGLDEEFLSVIGEVIVPCAANNTYESPDSTTKKGDKYTVTDKFYLVSQQEIVGATSDIVVDDSLLLPYFDGATNADRIKYMSGSAAYWWGRSAAAGGASYNRVVAPDGTMAITYVNNSRGCVPACTIV